MTTKRARTAPVSEPKPAEAVSDDANIAAPAPAIEQPPAANEGGAASVAQPAGAAKDAAAPAASPVAEEHPPVSGEDVEDPAPAAEPTGTMADLAKQVAELRDVENKPAKQKVKAQKLAPADDPTAGITGVPIDYVPTPAVP